MDAIVCSRCGVTVTGNDERNLEINWNQHICLGRRSLWDMDMDLLGAVASGNMTEEEAWNEQDRRIAPWN